MHISPAVAGTDRSVSAAFVDSVLPDLLAHYRLQRATVLEQAGIDGAVFNDPGRLLPLLDVMRLFLVILEACGDPGLGFETGRRARPRRRCASAIRRRRTPPVTGTGSRRRCDLTPTSTACVCRPRCCATPWKAPTRGWGG